MGWLIKYNGGTAHAHGRQAQYSHSLSSSFSQPFSVKLQSSTHSALSIFLPPLLSPPSLRLSVDGCSRVMEIEERDQIRTRFSEHGQEQVAQNPPKHRRHDFSSSSALSSSSSSTAAEDQVKLAAISISFNARLKAADMPALMQEHAMRVARSIADSVPKRSPNSSLLARVLKKANLIPLLPLFIESPPPPPTPPPRALLQWW